MPLYWLVAVVIIIIIIVIFIIVITIIIKGAPLIWSEEAVTPLMVKSMNWMEEISVSIFSSWVSKLSNEHDGDDQLNGGYLCFNFLPLFHVLYFAVVLLT